jgi:hypothetical protein
MPAVVLTPTFQLLPGAVTMPLPSATTSVATEPVAETLVSDAPVGGVVKVQPVLFAVYVANVSVNVTATRSNLPSTSSSYARWLSLYGLTLSSGAVAPKAETFPNASRAPATSSAAMATVIAPTVVSWAPAPSVNARVTVDMVVELT